MTTDGTPAEDHFRRLNEDFYATRASHYFRHRLAFLALQAGKPHAVENLLAEEFSWGEVKFSSLNDDPDGLEPPSSSSQSPKSCSITRPRHCSDSSSHTLAHRQARGSTSHP